MTNKIIKYGLLLLMAGAIFTACEEKVVYKFDDAPSLYFYRNQYTANSEGVMQYDSIGYSFFLAGSAQETEIWLQVDLTGKPSAQDRKITITQSNAGEPGAAVAGTHYVAFDDARIAEYMVMPANATSTVIPLILTRTTSMDTEEYRIVMEITANDNFTQGTKQWSGGQRSFIVNVTAKISKPIAWDRNYDNTFGEWGAEKMRFLIDYVGYTDFEYNIGYDTEYRYFWNITAKTALAEYEALHGPLYEADGITQVTFP